MNDNTSRCATDNELIAIEPLKDKDNIKDVLSQNAWANQCVAFHDG